MRKKGCWLEQTSHEQSWKSEHHIQKKRTGGGRFRGELRGSNVKGSDKKKVLLSLAKQRVAGKEKGEAFGHASSRHARSGHKIKKSSGHTVTKKKLDRSGPDQRKKTKLL